MRPTSVEGTLSAFAMARALLQLIVPLGEAFVSFFSICKTKSLEVDFVFFPFFVGEAIIFPQ